MAGRGIDITIAEQGLAEVRRRLGDMERSAPAQMANALNKTQTVLKKLLPEQVAKMYTYRRKLEKPRMRRASRKKLIATLFYDRKNTTLLDFDFSLGAYGNPRSTPGQKLSAKIRGDGSLKPIDRAFMEGEKVSRRLRSDRFPIKIVSGPGEHSMIRQVWQDEDARRYTAQTLSKKLDEQIHNAYLKKWGLR